MLFHCRQPPNILFRAGYENRREPPAAREQVDDRKTLDQDLEPQSESREHPSKHARIFRKERCGDEAVDFWLFGECVRFKHVSDPSDDRDMVRV